jgi:predicted transport protein
MKLYSLKDKKLNSISSQTFKLEREIQEIVEENLSVLFNLELVKSEFRIKNFRIDSLGFDRENKSFVIIEYKKDKNFSVIDQGYTYLSLMLNNKSDFILEYNENCDDNLRRGDIDWSQSRVIFISPQFTEYQKNSVNFKDVPFELWEITQFQNQTIGLNKIETNSVVDINTTSSDEKSVVKRVSEEIVTIDEEYHLGKSTNRPDSVIELYQKLKERILQLGDDIEQKFNKQTINFKRYSVFTDLIIYNKGVVVVINLRKGELEDPFSKTEDLSGKGHWGNGDYKLLIKSEEDIEYGISLIKQSYNKQV